MEQKLRNTAKRDKGLQPEDTATRILNQAMRLFLDKGYHGTSIDDITQSAGITKGALYWYFDSKESLLRRILKEFEKNFLDGLIEGVTEVKGGALDKFEKYIRYISAFAYYNRELCVSFTTLAAELVGAHHGTEPEFKKIYKKYRKFLSELVLQGKKEKVFKEELDPDLAALVMTAFHDGILLQWSMNRERDGINAPPSLPLRIDGEAYVNTFKKIMLKGLMV